jgi:hypothetical protein
MYPLGLTQYIYYSLWGSDDKILRILVFNRCRYMVTRMMQFGRPQIRYGHFLNIGTSGDITIAF